MATPKQAHTLSTYFISTYTDKYGVKPDVNRHASRWAFDSMLMDMTVAEIKALIDYYFETMSANNHSLDFFLYNYERLMQAKRIKDEDVTRLSKIAEDTERRTKEWRNRIDNNRT